MQGQGYTEKDWKLFRSKIAGWQENYMDRLSKEYIKLLSRDANASERFWELDKRLREDKRKVGVQARMSRSNLLYNLESLLREGAVKPDDLEEFSDELKERMRAYFGK